MQNRQPGSLRFAREDPVEDGGVQEHPGSDVERTLDHLAAAAGDAWQQEQVRASATLRARCAELLARTGWSPQRLAAELCRRELRTACEPVRVLAYRARILLETAPTAQRAAAAAAQAVAPTPRQEHDHAPHATEPAHEGQTRHATELEAMLAGIARYSARRSATPAAPPATCAGAAAPPPSTSRPPWTPSPGTTTRPPRPCHAPPAGWPPTTSG